MNNPSLKAQDSKISGGYNTEYNKMAMHQLMINTDSSESIRNNKTPGLSGIIKLESKEFQLPKIQIRDENLNKGNVRLSIMKKRNGL